MRNHRPLTAAPPALPAPDVDIAILQRWAAQLQPAHREAISHLFSPAAIEAATIARRDALLVSMIAGRQGSSLGLARQIHADLTRYAASRWRYESDRAKPADARHELHHQILRLSGGKILTVRRLRCILSAKKLSTKTAANGQPSLP
ncbi:UNVERIFIED_ORG: hypothetical protein M2348_000695 [Sphingomonas sp. R1F5B]